MRISLVWVVASLFTFLFLSFCNTTFAQSSPSAKVKENTIIVDPGAVEVGDSLIDPSSPLYFLKALRERIELYFAKTERAKINRELEFSVRRLREVRSLLKKENTDLVPPTLETYKSHLARVADLAGKNETMQIEAGEAISRHLDVMQRMYDSIGHPRSKKAMLAAIVRAQDFNRKFVKDMSKEAMMDLSERVSLRQLSACNFLVRESTSSALSEIEKTEITQQASSCKEDIAKYF